MTQPHRLPTGGRIDRTRPLGFRFNGRDYQGYAGDTLASALLANGVFLVGRSFKYHRPRGIFGAGAEEPNALVSVGEGASAEPNLKATQVELAEGLIARSVNCWPSPRFDLRAVNQLFAAMLPGGFYYKTFMWPDWHLFEGAIRRAAGLGEAPKGKDPDRYQHRHAECDVLVVGGGPAGLAAALDAGRAGRRVILVEEHGELGGSDLCRAPAPDASLAAALADLPNVTVLRRTTVFGYYDHNALAAVERLADAPRQRLWKLRAAEVVLATGAHERPLVFPGNDRPGVMLASAVQTYLHRHAVLCGRRVVVFTNNDSAYETAFALREAGAEVLVVDARAAPAHDIALRALAAGIVLKPGMVVAGTRGRARVTAAVLATADGTPTETLACDLIAVSGGWSPAVHLFSQSGGRLRFDSAQAMFVPDRPAQAVRAVGGAAGEVGALGIQPLWAVPGCGKAFVDLANDVTAADIGLAARENYVSVEHLKRYTTLGMGTDQGKTSNVNGLAIMGEHTGRAPGDVGTTKFRPPYTPVTMGAVAGPLVGSLYRPPKYLPLHEWHVARGAAFEDYGGWLRPTAYPAGAETWTAAARREARAAREGAALFDGSPLGKIIVAGPDAGVFLDHIYVGTASSLAVGRARYGLMLNENGVIIDDGVFVRTGADRFLVHTTSGGADRIAAMLDEWLQCEWVDFDVAVLPVTTAWSTLTLSGPRARDVLAAVGTNIDLTPSAFPHMHYREGTVAGLSARVLRASFTGEASYEISVPAHHARPLADAIWQAGAAYGLVPIGIEALMILRTEKGYLHVGVDTDGTTLPDDVGMAGPIARKAANFVGRRSLMRPDSVCAGRLHLVGLLSDDGSLLAVGAQVMGGAAVPCATDGHVTSSADSVALGRPVALALVRGGRGRLGEKVRLYDMGRVVTATIVSPVFHDQAGERLNA